jgi:hypothetical protein
MKYSTLFFALALAATAGTANLAFAADPATPPTQAATMPGDNLSTQATTENAAQQDFAANVDPLSNVRGVSPYDQEDAFKGANGFPLPGWDVFSVNAQANGG